MGDPLTDSAVRLAGIALPVLPLLPRAKRPRYRGGFQGATSNVEKVTEWWSEHPADNIGIRPPRSMVVVDIDPRNGGDVAMRKLVDQHGALPHTWVVQTGSGGWHYWFAVGAIAQIRAHPWPGVDIKHGGTGYVVAPPSVHPNGNRYRWLSPPLGAPAPAPGWLLQALQPPAAPAVVYTPPSTGIGTGNGRYTVRCLVARIIATPKGSRNSTLFGACRDAARQGDLDAYEPELVAAALARGLTNAEVAATVRSAGRGGPP